MTARRTASEIIATHLGYDMAEMSDYRYQPTRYSSPSIYAIGDFYYCSPSAQNCPPKNWGKWEFLAQYYGRSVYRIHMNSVGA